MTRAVILAHRLGAGPEVVLVKGEHPGLHWGVGFGLPGVTVHASDALSPRTGRAGQAGAGAVAADGRASGVRRPHVPPADRPPPTASSSSLRATQ